MEIMINGILWSIWFVPAGCECLYSYDTNDYRLGMCDLEQHVICVRDDLPYEKTKEVLQHELSHGISYSFGYPVDALSDELLANYSGNYADEIHDYAEEVLFGYGY